MKHPSWYLSSPPQSGHCPATFLTGPDSTGAVVSTCPLPLFPTGPLMWASSTMAIASAHERTDFPSSQAIDGHLIPRNCLTISVGSSPDRSDSDISLVVASSWAEAQPPA